MDQLLTPATAADLVSSNRVVYRCATPTPECSLLLGNGPLNVAMHTPGDALVLSLGRGDAWISTGDGIRSTATARVRIELGLGALAGPVRQECDPYAARITVTAGAITAVLTCLRGHDLVLVEIDDQRTTPVPIRVVLDNWHAGDVTTAGTDGIETVHVERSSAFAALNRRVGVDAAGLGMADPLLGRAWGLWLHAPGATAAGTELTLPPARRHRLRIAGPGVVPSAGIDSASALRQAGRALAYASDGVLDDWLVEHAAWWQDFWSRSHIRLVDGSGDAAYEERLWVQSMYGLACGLGGPLPVRHNGGGFLLDRDQRCWDYGYWLQNTREIYWPLPASGHAELMRGLFDMYLAARPFVRAQTQAVHGVAGLCYPETQTFWGMDQSVNLPEQWRNEVTDRVFSGNLELCLLMEWYVRASGDDTFLRQSLYPVLVEVIAFYRGIMRPGEDGMLHLVEVNSIEIWGRVSDPAADLAGLHHLLPRLIAWGGRFGATADQLAGWREMERLIPPLPVGRLTTVQHYMDHIHTLRHATAVTLDPAGHLLPFAAIGTQPVRQKNMENAELYPVFPFGRIGLESDPATRRTAQLTWMHRTWRLPNNSWAQDVPQLARLGMGEEAGQTSLAHASYSQRFPSGAFIGPSRPHFHGQINANPYFDATGVHCTGLQEMLLQSHDGIIRIAPAMPRSWSASFRLHAFDGFVVEAAIEHGVPRTARITATRGGCLRLRNASREPLRITGGDVVPPGGLLECATTPQEVVMLVWGDGSTPSLAADDSHRREEIVWPGWRIGPPLTAIVTGHWHDECHGHGQVGLPEDGLYPATRGLGEAAS